MGAPGGGREWKGHAKSNRLTVEGNICGLSSKENLPASSNKCCPDMLDDTEHREESLWSLFHKLKAVLENPPAVERKTHPVTYDDSRRVVDMTEILPNLFVGDEGAAKNAFYLKKIKVTHVLNAAQGSGPGFVDTDENFYKSF